VPNQQTQLTTTTTITTTTTTASANYQKIIKNNPPSSAYTSPTQFQDTHTVDGIHVWCSCGYKHCRCKKLFCLLPVASTQTREGLPGRSTHPTDKWGPSGQIGTERMKNNISQVMTINESGAVQRFKEKCRKVMKSTIQQPCLQQEFLQQTAC